MKKIGLIFCLAVTCLAFVNAQTIPRPNYGLKTPETLEIIRIETNPQETIIYLNLENRITGGYFCADKNIYIIYPDGKKSRLSSSKGIPVCPETHKFNSIGEKLSFELTFPALKKDTQWIDLIEDCKENCFSFYGICLSNDLNKKIDEASVLAENKEPAKALVSFIKIADSIKSGNSGIEGLLYMNIIKLSKETGNDAKAAEWFGKLKSSAVQRKDAYINNLNFQGISY